ncbi:HAMP domain-containing histidine kinase [bacterium]|nr:HAMP domain-containing histidine kinase [bacterium]MBU1959204.1 HAMP domain-containing histidine kinase [bacterium]
MKPYGEQGIALFHNERRALIGFLLIYVSSSIVMLGSIGFLYYKEKIATIDRYCDVSMENMAMQIKMEILDHKNINSFFDDIERLRIGLYDQNHQAVVSNLTTKKIDFDQTNYTHKTSAFFVSSFIKPVDGIKYVVIEDSKVSGEMIKLKSLIWTMFFIASFFVAIIGYFLSRLLLNPVKENFAILNRFMKDSAHELNTPVTALMMSANYLKKSYDKEMVEHMLMSSKMISEIYNSISYLAFHDIDIEEKELFELSKLIENSTQYFKEIAASKSIILNTKLNPLTIYMDKNSAKKLINNLITNAIKYSYSGKSIDIILQGNVLKIKDQGVGINKKDQKKIFQRYKRINKQSAGGFGIGLDIVLGICRSNDIVITLDSKIGKGSTFTLVFPQEKGN